MLKKGEIYEGKVEDLSFPDKGKITLEGQTVYVKGTLPNQTVSFSIKKARHGICEGKLISVLRRSDLENALPTCAHFGECGGCSYQRLSYENQLSLKAGMVQKLISEVCPGFDFEGILPGPVCRGYRNKMEYAFGDESMGGKFALGLHRKNSFYDILNTDGCVIVNEDFNVIREAVRDYFDKFYEKGEIDFFHRGSHLGYLRHLLLRRSEGTGEILIALITAPPAGSEKLKLGRGGLETGEVEPPASGDRPPAIPDEFSASGNVSETDEFKAPAGLDIIGSGRDEPSASQGKAPASGDRPPAIPDEFSASGNVSEAEEFKTPAGLDIIGAGRDEPSASQGKAPASDEERIIKGFAKTLLTLEKEGSLTGKIAGICHVYNSALSDTVRCDSMRILYGSDRMTERVLGLEFEVSLFSFFQTNSKGCEVLYKKALEYAGSGGGDCAMRQSPGFEENSEYAHAAGGRVMSEESGAASRERADWASENSRAARDGNDSERTPEYVSGTGGVIYDLYCGTGTIAQLMSRRASKVIGIEINEDAAESARKNAARNGISNAVFIAGDVLRILREERGMSLPKPDIIILDPPRDGINPKALRRIIEFNAEKIIYISCKPTSLSRDLESFKEAGYRLEKASCVDMFPQTLHVETVVLMSRVSNEPRKTGV